MKNVAIITGSGTGVGAATARMLAGMDYNVVVNYTRSETEAHETAEACEGLGAETLVVKADVAKDSDCRRLAEEAIQKWQRIDVLVNSAGITRYCPHDQLDGIDKEDFLNMYSVNVVGVYQMTRAVTNTMKAQGKGAIVNVASIAGVNGIGSSVAYAASKGALITMTYSLARALAPEIRVNAVSPGYIKGRWVEGLLGPEKYEEVTAKMEQIAPLGMVATHETVAEAIVWLATGADIATGQNIILDAGHHLVQPSI